MKHREYISRFLNSKKKTLKIYKIVTVIDSWKLIKTINYP